MDATRQVMEELQARFEGRGMLTDEEFRALVTRAERELDSARCATCGNCNMVTDV